MDDRPDFNPYAPPDAAIGTTDFGGDVGDADAVRRELLHHEASIRSLGCLYYWSGIVTLFAAAAMLVFGLAGMAGSITEGLLGPDAEGGVGLVVGIAVLYGALGWLNLWIGRHLRRLESKGRTVLTLFLVLGLFGFPFGTVISAYFLWILHSEKGKRILSPEYRRVVELTPHIRYRTPVWVWIVLGLLVLGIVAAMALGIAGA